MHNQVGVSYYEYRVIIIIIIVWRGVHACMQWENSMINCTIIVTFGCPTQDWRGC